MMLKQQRATTHAVAFEVDLTGQRSKSKNSSHIQKKLEENAKQAAQGPQITLEQISQKLIRAEQKRKQSLANQISPKVEERRRIIRDKKMSADRTSTEQLKVKIEKTLESATEKRCTNMEHKQQKVREHIKKVNEIKTEQATKRKLSTDNLQQEIEHKLNMASQKKEEELEKKIATAVKLA